MVKYQKFELNNRNSTSFFMNISNFVRFFAGLLFYTYFMKQLNIPADLLCPVS